jgi:hypothetical protein
MIASEDDYELGEFGEQLFELGVYDDVQVIIKDAAMRCIRYERARCAAITRRLPVDPIDPDFFSAEFISGAKYAKHVIEQHIMNAKETAPIEEMADDLKTMENYK